MPDGRKKYIQVIVIKAVMEYAFCSKNKEWQYIGAQAAFHYVYYAYFRCANLYKRGLVTQQYQTKYKQQ